MAPTIPEEIMTLDPEGIEKKKKWRKSAKKPRIKMDRTEYRRVDRKILPPDAEHKGYRSVVVQNIKFTTDNVEYKLERFYSPSENKLYEAELPEDIHGEFKDDLKVFVVYLYYACRVTHRIQLQKFLTRVWAFYDLLDRFRKNPDDKEKRKLETELRKISNGTRSEDGKTAWENMMSILDTCKKQGVGFFDYIRDIFSGKRAMTRLALKYTIKDILWI